MKKSFKRSLSKKLFFLCAVLSMMMAVCIGCGSNNSTADSLVRVGSLKGPTSIGLLNLMEDNNNGSTTNKYSFTIEAQADIIAAMLTKGELDIALIPANLASVLFNKTEGKITVIDINTLGVLYMLSADDSISSVNDLAGKTIYLTGKGTTPDFVLRYILEGNGLSLDDVTLEYKSEATEILGAMSNDPAAVALLPQPFATVAMAKNDSLKVIFDMTKEWSLVNGDSDSILVTGVTVVRNDFLKDNEAAVVTFLAGHEYSSKKAVMDIDGTAALTEKYGIIDNAAIAKKAIPMCNIFYIDGEDMKNALRAYLEVLEQYDNSFIGGQLPSDDFFFVN